MAIRACSDMFDWFRSDAAIDDDHLWFIYDQIQQLFLW